ncbi:hypothetical protein ELE36_11785 [Pseudolysobacter antarcticus]|uniref:IPTL-CTERM sorting domain-containing protein n=1 Tax=Pseudolysobacter antarcticus TaxID=2511995 RepID=A0A411HKN9_9GAMM|nr:MBG domain-containing protein [Pseudolysobacter antarcticus]QBB70974.1 hypothetical protein ELE36_11785 [Pseudolysobacter antarcticus]
MRCSKNGLLPLLVCASLILTSLPLWAATCRVTTTGIASNDGSDWTTHAITLQGALSNSACSEIWLAKGVYKPVTPANLASVTGTERSASFNIHSGVAIYGGFAGGETARADRDFAANLTVLSGDIDGNDTNTNGVDLTVDATHNGSNSNTVVQLDGRTTPINTDTVLDGVTVTAGNNPSAGGGLYCNAEGNGDGNPPGSDIRCSPTVSNVRFSGNFASGGGGAMVNDALYGGISSPVLTNVVFSNNSVDNGGSTQSRGGAMLNGGAAGSVSKPVLTNVTFIGNSATNGIGGAMFNAGNFGDCSPVLNNVTFTGNSAINGFGGAMVNYGFAGNSSPTLNNVVFNGNSTTGSGGAIYNYGSGFSAGANVSPTLNNVTFSGNSAQLKGGAMYNDGSSGGNSNPTLSNVTFSGNTAPNGAALYNDATGSTYTTNSGTSSPTLNNVTFSGNSASGKGGAMYNDGSANGFTSGHSSPVLNNVILWGDTGGELFNNSATATTALHYSVMQGGCTSGDGNTCTDHVLITDPKLGTLANNGGFTQTRLPGAGSSAIDAGDNSSCASTDQRGVPRPQGAVCDIGAVEVAAASLSAAFSPASVAVGSTTTFTITATNPTSIALTNVSFSNSVPAGLKLVAQAGGTCGTAAGTGGGSTSVNAATGFFSTVANNLAAGASCTISLQVLALNAGSFLDTTSTVTSSEALAGAAASATLLVTTPLTITANDATKTYGNALPTLSASYSGFVNGDTAASVTIPPTLTTTATAASPVVGGGYPITASGAVVPSYYTVTYVPGALSITSAPLTITANNASRAYGAVNPGFSANYSGFVNGDSTASLTPSPTITTTATDTSPAGPYPITASGAVDPNYVISYVDGTLTIGKADQAIAFGTAPVVAVNGTGAATATTTATPSTSYPIIFSTTSVDCSVTSTGLVTGINAGTSNCMITAAQSGDANYNAAAPVNQNLSIGKDTTTLTLAVTPNPVNFNAPITIVAIVSGDPPTGTVTFCANATTVNATCDGGFVLSCSPVTLVAAGPTSATATCNFRGFSTAGNQTLSAFYSGDDNFTATATAQVVVLAVSQPIPIPVLGRWMLLLLAGLMVGIARTHAKRA